MIAVGVANPPVRPGDQSNPKLVVMFNQEIDDFERDLLSATLHPGYHDGAAANGRAWLKRVDVVESYCRRSGRFSHTAADVRLRDGELLEDRVVDTTSCSAEGTIEMRVRFAEGRVVDVQTDSSELQFSPDAARRQVEGLLREVVQVEMDTNKAAYFKHAVERAPSLEQQWAAVPSGE